jgi:DNA polymerase phi
MSNKRKFSDIEGVDRSLVQIYEMLADDREDFRLSAAHSLVSRILDPKATNTHQIKVALTRLCRGLCSSRKAARLGFCVALTELISQLGNLSTGEDEYGITASYLIDNLESQTIPEGNTSGQVILHRRT